MKKLLFLLLFFVSSAITFSQNIVAAEYFFDVDPGCGNGSPILIAPGATVSFPASIPVSGLSAGFHFIAIRTKDSDGKWSMFEKRGFYVPTPTTNTATITAAEYFIDSDPGPGNGNPIPVGASGDVVNFYPDIPANTASGFHYLGIRTKDGDGKWGHFEKRGFYIPTVTTDMPVITAAEYFYDNDPGVGNGTPVNVTPGNIVTQTFEIPVPGTLSPGRHYLGIRVKNQQGNWSLFERDSVIVSTGTITCPGNITVAPFTNDCKAVVPNIDAIGLPEDDSSYSYTLSGATSKSGIGTASGQLFNAGVTTVTYALLNSPGVSCSFTVTVNSSVTPTASISIPVTTICEGSLATFVCTYTGGGFTPISWQWKKNGINVGTNSNIYRDSTLENNDAITVSMTSAISCAVPQTVTSAPVIMTVHETITPAVSIIASATTICPGQSITFTAIPTNGGSQPIYDWVKNGSVVATGSTYQASGLVNGDSVFVRMTNTTDCITVAPVMSNVIHLTASGAVTPYVVIEANAAAICNGQTVIFTAIPGNAGNYLAYEWTLNGNAVGNGSNIYQNSSLVNGDKIRVTMQTSQACGGNISVFSNTITMIVGADVTPSVTMSSSHDRICAGTLVTFYASPISGAGSSPAYQWKRNGINIAGATGSTYQSSSLENGDVIRVEMTSSLSCANPQSVLSHDSTTMEVSSVAVTPSVSVAVTNTTICQNQPVTFTAIPTNGGLVPGYQWKVNGVDMDVNSETFETTSLINGDVVSVTMTSSLGCVSPQSVTSTGTTMTVMPSIPAYVEIGATATIICTGTIVEFNVTSAGDVGTYQWQLNGNNIPGATSPSYQSSSLTNGDKIKLVITPSSPCGFPSAVVSNEVTITVNPPAASSVSITASSETICSGTQVTFTAASVNGGNPTYQWNVNGASAAITNSNTFQSSTLENGDFIVVWMTTSLGCVSPLTVPSNTIVMNVSTGLTYYRDLDGDGFGNAASGTTQACGPYPGWVASNTDCNDNNAAVFPGATETCGNNIDDDCDGQTDEGCTDSADVDGDGYTVAQGDCNDNNASVHPGATEACGNNIDDDCDGQTDEGCNTTLPTLILRTYPAKEGDLGQTVLDVEITLSAPATLPVTVQFSTANEDATAGSDYIPTNGSLVIPAGANSGSVQVRIVGDLLRETNERFRINFTNPVNAMLVGEAYSRIMIIDDDKGKARNTVARAEQVPLKEEIFKIPTMARRNQVWTIPQIGNFENEVIVLSIQGQVVTRFVNYRNQSSLGNLSSGLYFYRIRIKEDSGKFKDYTGKLMIAE